MALRTSRSSCIVYAPSLVSTSGACHGKFKLRQNIHTNISLSLTENKIYGLLGKNGTGKSTLLYLIAGLLKPTDGRVTADGISTTERRQATLEDMFIINEEFTLPQIKDRKSVV